MEYLMEDLILDCRFNTSDGLIDFSSYRMYPSNDYSVWSNHCNNSNSWGIRLIPGLNIIEITDNNKGERVNYNTITNKIELENFYVSNYGWCYGHRAAAHDVDGRSIHECPFCGSDNFALNVDDSWITDCCGREVDVQQLF